MPNSTDDDRSVFDDLDEVVRTAKMRPDALASIRDFVRSVAHGGGGSLFIQAPYGRRDLMEIGYRSEGWARLAG